MPDRTTGEAGIARKISIGKNRACFIPFGIAIIVLHEDIHRKSYAGNDFSSRCLVGKVARMDSFSGAKRDWSSRRESQFSWNFGAKSRLENAVAGDGTFFARRLGESDFLDRGGRRGARVLRIRR